MPAHIPHYPTAFSDTYVKASSYYSSSYYHWFAFNPSLSLVGSASSNSWGAIDNSVPQRINVDFENSFILGMVLLENYHDSGSSTLSGVKTFRIYGSNSSTAFTTTDGSDLTDLTLLGEFVALEHVSANSSDPQYFYISSNYTEYRYLCIIFIDVLSSGQSFIGVRRITYYSVHESLKIVVSDDTIGMYPIKLQKFIVTKQDNYGVVKNVFLRGILKIKLASTVSVNNITTPVSGVYLKTRHDYKRRQPVYINGDIYTETNGIIQGIVTVSGTVWPGVTVRLYYNIDGNIINQTITDENGNFEFYILEPLKDYFTVIAHHDGFNAIVYDRVKSSIY